MAGRLIDFASTGRVAIEIKRELCVPHREFPRSRGNVRARSFSVAPIHISDQPLDKTDPMIRGRPRPAPIHGREPLAQVAARQVAGDPPRAAVHQKPDRRPQHQVMACAEVSLSFDEFRRRRAIQTRVPPADGPRRCPWGGGSGARRDSPRNTAPLLPQDSTSFLMKVYGR